MLMAVRRLVNSFTYAVSSSTYGDYTPKEENNIGTLSPYAVVNMSMSYMHRSLQELGFKSIGLRY